MENEGAAGEKLELLVGLDNYFLLINFILHSGHVPGLSDTTSG